MRLRSRRAGAIMTEWRRLPISPYRSYEISSDGQIRRNRRILKGDVDSSGYRRVLLYYAGLSKRFKVHRLVCEVFHGPCPEGLECAHLNSDKLDNRSVNLAWVTRSENMRHNVARGAIGGGVAGERHHAAKLSDEQVAELRAKAASGRSGRSLALEYGIRSAQASAIIRGAARREAMRHDGGGQ